MAHAVAEGLSGYLMKGRTAAGVVFVTVPHEAVDVNVHPTKQEIRFQQPNQIHERIVSTVRLGLDNYQQSAKHALFGRNLELNKDRADQRYPAKKIKSKTPDVCRLPLILFLWPRLYHDKLFLSSPKWVDRNPG